MYLLLGVLSEPSDQVTMETDTPGGWQGQEDLREENGERLSFDRLT